MVTRLDLVLDDKRYAVREIGADQVERERAHRMLGTLEFEVESSESISKHVDIGQEPRREVRSLVLPDLADVEPLDSADLCVHRNGAYDRTVSSADLSPASRRCLRDYAEWVATREEPRRWSAEELKRELARFEAVLRSAELRESSVATYVGRTSFFIRWLEGDYTPRGPNK